MTNEEILQYYYQCTNEVRMCYNAIKHCFLPDSAQKLMEMRTYIQPHHEILAKNIGFVSVPEDKMTMYINGFYGFNPLNLNRNVAGNEFNAVKESFLVTKNGNFLLNNRFIIPVEDFAGNYVALIGYYPDSRKYITAASPFFSKEAMFFNFRKAYKLSYEKFEGLVIVVEGIFDCLSLDAIGLPCIATMGATVSPLKCELLKYFNKVIGIPDGDKVGQRSINQYGYNKKSGWNVPSNTTMLRIISFPIELPDGNTIKIKDMDDFAKFYSADDVRNALLSYANSTNAIEELVIGG